MPLLYHLSVEILHYLWMPSIKYQEIKLFNSNNYLIKRQEIWGQYYFFIHSLMQHLYAILI